MNVIKLVKDIWNGDVFAKKKIESKMDMTPEEHPSGIGCLAKGLVESFKNEPDLWEDFTMGQIHYKHSLKKYTISFFLTTTAKNSIESVVIYLQHRFSNLTQAESFYVYERFMAYVVNPRIEKEKREEKLRFEKENAYFIDLGCPKG